MAHFVYALQAAEDAGKFSSYVKIGHSNDPASRMVTHRIGSPIPLKYVRLYRVRVRELGIEMERKCHRQFAHKRVHGEWFVIDLAELDDFVESLARRRGFQVTSSTGKMLPPKPYVMSIVDLKAQARSHLGINQ